VTQNVRSDPGGLVPGEQLAGYQIQEQIGRGGMAVVYRALDLRLGRQVALKVLAPNLSEDEAFRQRFIRESRAAAGVDHPHIIPVFEAGEAAGMLFIAMRYVGHGDVRSLIEDHGRLRPARAAAITSQVASALDAAHAHGLVHRDVKPGNILLALASDDSDHVYLSDFGLSKHSLTPSTLTSTGQFLGTLDYVSPEQIQGQPVDGRADQYALACAAVEMLTGSPPFLRDDSMALMWAQLEAEPPRPTERRPELAPAVDEVIAAAMAKSPAGRYPTCRDFAMALAAACGQSGRPRTSGASGPAQWPEQDQRQHSGQWPDAPPALEPQHGYHAPEPGPPPNSWPWAGDDVATGALAGTDAGSGPRDKPSASWDAPASWHHDDAGATSGVAQPPAGMRSPTDYAAGFAGGPPGRDGDYRTPGRDADVRSPGRGSGLGSPGWDADRAPTSQGADFRSPGWDAGRAPTSQAADFRSPGWDAELAPTSQPADYVPGGRRSGFALPGRPAEIAPPGRPGQPGRPPAGPGQNRHRGRNVALAVIIVLVGIAGLAGIGYKLSHRPDGSVPPPTVTTTVQATVGDPARTVRDYFAAINHHRYLVAWRLSGEREKYSAFVAGFAGTAHDTVTILSTQGDVVSARLVARQSDGTVKTFQGTYTVTGGKIASTNVRQTG
jgi:serine/threonine-protein kinase